jgi:protein TonB
MRFAVGASLLVHLLIGVLLLVTVPRKQQEEQLPPPAAVTMMFDRGRANGPTAAQPQPDTMASPTQPAPPVPKAAPPAAEPALPEPPPPPPPQAEAKPVPAPPPEAEPSPAPKPQPPEPVTPAEPRPAVQPLPPAVPLPVPAPPPAPEAQPLPPPSSQPLPLPPSPPQPRISPPPKLALPRVPPPPPRHAAPPKPTDFPPPMNFSFGGGRLSPSVQPPAQPDFSIGPAKPGPDDSTPFGDIQADKAGPDWRNALSRWVSQHAYYPPQARGNGEEGTASVQVVARPDGKVTSVELVGRSGSMWLDLALQSLFRDAHIPPLPSGMTEPMAFTFTMHYILIRR